MFQLCAKVFFESSNLQTLLHLLINLQFLYLFIILNKIMDGYHSKLVYFCLFSTKKLFFHLLFPISSTNLFHPMYI